MLAQNADDLLLGEPASLHSSVSPQGRGLYSNLEEFSGLRSLDIVHDDVDVEIDGGVLLHSIEEPAELLCSVPRHERRRSGPDGRPVLGRLLRVGID
jgi:hypothetical protein